MLRVLEVPLDVLTMRDTESDGELWAPLRPASMLQGNIQNNLTLTLSGFEILNYTTEKIISAIFRENFSNQFVCVASFIEQKEFSKLLNNFYLKLEL